jgi:hypothetical protein
MSPLVDIEVRISALFQKAGISGPAQVIEPLGLGGNNRAYRVETTGGVFAVKQYFSHAGDSRNRLLSEYAFLVYAAKSAPGMASAALACDYEHGVALYEFIDGVPFNPGKVTAEHVGVAAQFFSKLNDPGYRSGAQLPLASEACFSILEHLNLIDIRLKKLARIEKKSQADCDALDLIMCISSQWQSLKASIENVAQEESLNLARPIEIDQRCISPSDFGFHNALLQPHGGVRFLDFEYAGWDDPAKMIGDFFSQLAVPIGIEHFERFTDICLAPFPRRDELLARACLLRPVYQVKWCCIALNVFLSVNLARRKFANPNLDEQTLKTAQLAKAQRLFQSISLKYHGLH